MIALANSDLQGQDGTGAQVLRLLIHYRLARKYGIPFRFLSINKIDSNPGDSFSSLEERKNFIVKLNYFFSRLLTPASGQTTLFIRRIFSLQQMDLILRFVALLARLRIVPKILMSFNNCITYSSLLKSKFPEYCVPLITQICGSQENPNNQNLPQELKVVIHIRGALNTDQRFKPFELYRLLLWIQELSINNQLESKFFLHTDTPKCAKSWKIGEENYKGTIDSWRQFNLIDLKNEIFLNGFDFEKEFKGINQLRVLRDLDPIEAWSQMSGCQILIGCKSSFSIVSSLLSQPLITIVPKQDNFEVPEDWIVSPATYELNQNQRNFITRKIGSLVELTAKETD
jgi:hypothetical protein